MALDITREELRADISNIVRGEVREIVRGEVREIVREEVRDVVVEVVTPLIKDSENRITRMLGEDLYAESARIDRLEDQTRRIKRRLDALEAERPTT